MKKHITYLKKLHACEEAIEWAEQFPTLQKAWDVCERGDWMLWLVGKQSGNAAYAAAAYADAAARRTTLKQCADIVRKDYPKIRIK